MTEIKSNSNIIAGSNVYHCETDEPWFETEFMMQVKDPALLKEVEKRHGYDNRVKIPGLQHTLLQYGKTCIYAKHDPCIGFDERVNKVRIACVNGDCPKIYKCNPLYKPEDTKLWNASVDDINKYGNPQDLQRYYIVDMISEEERLTYDIEPGNFGRDYSAAYHPIIEEVKDYKTFLPSNTRYEDGTGRKLYLVGYQWKCTDNDYEDRDLVAIWAYEDELKITTPPRIHKTELIKEKQVVETPKVVAPAPVVKEEKKAPEKDVNAELTKAEKKSIENNLQENISGSISLMDIEPYTYEDSRVVIILDNPAEKAFVSMTLCENDIEHGYMETEQVLLLCADDVELIPESDVVLISSTFVDNGCFAENADLWKKLSRIPDLQLLQMVDREYFKYTDEDNRELWCCRNMYGITHVQLTETDIKKHDFDEDGIYKISLVCDTYAKCFKIVDEYSAFMGETSSDFFYVMRSLENNKELEDDLSSIINISIKIEDGNLQVLGMGYLKFMGY